jgi:glycosyltransferase involved in cell wall biosynthesis
MPKICLNYISSSSIYVDLSSQSTGLEPSLIEAMAQKKVVIGSELSPISEIIEDTKDGFLVRPADDITLSTAPLPDSDSKRIATNRLAKKLSLKVSKGF